MTSVQESDILTRVGPGTPMGNLMRHYWLPALKSSELKADGDPVRFLLLGERLIGFRDTAGRVGVMDHRCPHRCASLFLGRNEEGGIRCVYHGWKYDVTGQCIDQANLPPGKTFTDKVRAKAYRTCERNGIVYVYMGDTAELPSLPEITATQIPEAEVDIIFLLRRCNWLQAMEGDIDTSHLNFLHFGSMGASDFAPSDPNRFGQIHRDPEYMAEATDLGTIYGAYRPADNDQTYWRIAHFLFPCWTLAPFIAFDDYRIARAWVPLDDTHTMFIMIGPKGGLASSNRDKISVLPNATDWLGRFRSVQSIENDYLVDRALQRTKSFTGIEHVHIQDQAVTESMGEITDHGFENLAASDRMIALTRRRLLLAAKALAEEGKPPPGAATPEAYRDVGAGYFLAPKSRAWPEVYHRQLATLRGNRPTAAAE
jgi:phthalate 4,5-dioxygenase